MDLTYTRNYLRHRLLPFLQQGARATWSKNLSELAASGKRLSDRVEREAEEAWSSLVEPAADEIVIQASGLAALPEMVAVELIRKAAASLTAATGDLARTSLPEPSSNWLERVWAERDSHSRAG